MAKSNTPFALCAGGNEATLLGESLEDAALALEALGIAWQDRAKKLGVDGHPVSGDAIVTAYMWFGEARGRIQRVLSQGVMDRGDGVGRAWMLSVSDALDSVVNELNAHDATMTDLATELARAARLNRLASRLRSAQRELAYGHLVVVHTGDPLTADVNHSTDFRSVNWYGARYTFGDNQAACIKLLWENWAQGTPDVGGKTLLDKADCAGERLDLVFRDNPAWKTMIVSGERKGTYRLQEPAE